MTTKTKSGERTIKVEITDDFGNITHRTFQNVIHKTLPETESKIVAFLEAWL